MSQRNLPKKLKVSLKTVHLGLWEGISFKAGKIYFRNLMKADDPFTPKSIDVFLFRKGKWNKFSFALNESESLCVKDASIDLRELASRHEKFRSELLSTLGC